MFALFKLQSKGYFANRHNKTDFITTIMFIIVIGSLTLSGITNGWSETVLLPNGATINMGGANIDNEIFRMKISYANIAIITSIAMMMVMSAAMQTFGMSFFEMKDSVLLKRIGATKISKGSAVGSFILWGLTSMLFIIGWMSLWVGVFQIPAISESTNGLLYVDPSVWANVNWAGFFVAVITTSIAFYAIAFFFVSFNKNSESYQISSTFYFFLAVFLGGTFTPDANREWMTIISYLTPLGWGTDLAISSMIGNNVFDINSIATIEHVTNFEAIGRFVFPLLLGGLAGLASIKLFKWD